MFFIMDKGNKRNSITKTFYAYIKKHVKFERIITNLNCLRNMPEAIRLRVLFYSLL